MVEGEKTFDITLRWPRYRREDMESILDIPVDIQNNQLTSSPSASTSQTRWVGGGTGPPSTGTRVPPPAPVSVNIAPSRSFLPRLTLRQLVSPVGEDGRPNPGGSFIRPGGSIITREQGKRFIAVKFSVRERDLASVVDDVRKEIDQIYPAGYRFEMGGEFEQMQSAEDRLLIIVPAALVLIFMLLYFAFRSLLDVTIILSNVLFSTIGGVWALYLLNINFSISAAVGFVSLFGFAIMDGLLLVSYFIDLRSRGLPLNDAIMQAACLPVPHV